MNELELFTEELFPPTKEELEEILETIQKQLEDPKFEEHWEFLHQLKTSQEEECVFVYVDK